jgi:hypothetical protein
MLDFAELKKAAGDRIFDDEDRPGLRRLPADQQIAAESG